MATMTLEIETPDGVDVDTFRRECALPLADLVSHNAQEIRAIAEELELLQSDAVLDAWAEGNFYGAVGRACWYDRVCVAQEFQCGLRFRRDPRRPLHMRGSVWVLDAHWRSTGWRARIIDRYLRMTRYTATRKDKIERDIDQLDRRLVDETRPGWRRWVAQGRGANVPARRLVIGEAREPFVPSDRHEKFSWRDGKRVYALPGDQDEQITEGSRTVERPTEQAQVARLSPAISSS